MCPEIVISKYFCVKLCQECTFFEDSGHCPKILDYTLDYGYRVVDIDRYIDI